MKRVVGIIGLAVVAVLLMGGTFAVQGGWKKGIPGKIFWPEKEEVAHLQGRHILPAKAQPPGIVDIWWNKAVQDPCIVPLLFTVPGGRPRSC
ncbi:MAG: hypothetical protein HYT85_09315 [candidate division NC10 bacterium]|nr:hypothetical protein [candidate division NC10 bacterium]MBI2115267.1 hypothetical protein [candidate division NC10 bacterium]MBI2458472.1 hypothetical protein [candidate division NC10 bacterium]MBI3086778.1 hypothetical protein [candidate division NC10 bacterium]